MEIPFALLAETLERRGFEVVHCQKPDAPVFSVWPIGSHCSDHALAVAEVSDLLGTDDPPDCIVLCEPDALGASMVRLGSNVLLAPADSSVAEATAAAWEELLALADWEARMLRTSVTGGGLNDLLEVACERLVNPVAVFAGDGTLLERVGTFTGDSTGTIWDTLDGGMLGWSFYTRGDRDRMTHALRQSAPPFVFSPEADPTHRYLCSFVKARGTFAASLGMVDVNAPITTAQVQVVSIVTRAIGSYLAKNERALSLTRGPSAILSALLDGDDVPATAAANLSRDEGRGFVVASCSGRSGADTGEAPYLGELAQLLPDAVVTWHGESAVVLVPCSSTRVETETRLTGAMVGVDVVFGVSPPFRGLSNLPLHLAQARFAEKEAMQGEVNHLCFEDCAANYVADALVREGNVPLVVDSALQEVWDEGERGREQVSQLLCFLGHGGNYAAASRDLYLHRNSLIYRMRRLSEKLGLDLNDLNSARKLYLLLSCMCLVYGRSRGARANQAKSSPLLEITRLYQS